jgi:hypothetical protein
MKYSANSDLTERQQEIYELYYKFDCNTRLVAEHLSQRESSIIQSLWYIAKKKFVDPDKFSPVAPAGWSSKFKTVQYNGAGEIIQTWDRISPMEQSIESFLCSINERVKPKEDTIPGPKQSDIKKDTAFVWPCVDMHVGLAAWKPETLDSNYNLKICKNLEDAATIEMLKKIGFVDHIHLAFLGDTTHTDSKTNMTPESGNILDVDSRYTKIIWTCRDIICNKIEKSLEQANTVSVDIVQGNHDPNTAVCMLTIIDAYYRNEPRVEINISPAQFKFFKWGESICMGAHGHEAPPQRLATFLMDYVIQNEIKAKELYVFKANIHHRKKQVIPGIDECDGGVIVETFPTLTAKDGWHAMKGFSSKRGTKGKLFHKKYGLIDDVNINAKYLYCKYDIE